ncbi:SAM-dependent methyltransferase [Aliikangiella sp. IMCC44653]
MSNTTAKGELICVGTGIQLGAHITPVAKSAIQAADTVFMSVSNHFMEEWISQMNNDVRNLQSHYQKGLSRNQTYRKMLEVVVAEVKQGKNVCLCLYGHPGVFALVAHKAIQQLKHEGYSASMEPGISAEDCLIADLGLDPGKLGCQQYEATQFMMYHRQIDPSALLILWQIGVAGDMSLAKRNTSRQALQILIDLLGQHYPLSHQVILYEAKTISLGNNRIQKIALSDLVNAKLHDYTTLVIPACKELQKNHAVISQLQAIAH